MPVTDGTEVVIALDGYLERRWTLGENEEKLQKVNAEDSLCIGKDAWVKVVMEGMESFVEKGVCEVEWANVE